MTAPDPTPPAPCPFCQRTLVKLHPRGWPRGYWQHGTDADPMCFLIGAHVIDTAEAIAAWNRRAPATQAEGKPLTWWCEFCQKPLDWTAVTFEETHDARAGGCGRKVAPRCLVGPPPSATDVLVAAVRKAVCPIIKPWIDGPNAKRSGKCECVGHSTFHGEPTVTLCCSVMEDVALAALAAHAAAKGG